MNKRDYLEDTVLAMDNIQMNLKEMGQDGFYWLNLTQNREIVCSVKHGNEQNEDKNKPTKCTN